MNFPSISLYRLSLISSWWSMFLITLPAVDWFIAARLERHFTFFTAVCTCCFMHLSWRSVKSSFSSLSISIHFFSPFSLVLIMLCGLFNFCARFSYPINNTLSSHFPVKSRSACHPEGDAISRKNAESIFPEILGKRFQRFP